MSSIVCFTDSSAVTHATQHLLSGHELHVLSASRLTDAVRQLVGQIAPDVILLELSASMDNAHLYFFLRADRTTRNIPVILVSPSEFVEQQAAILEADGYLRRTALHDQLRPTISRFLPRTLKANAIAA